VHRFPVSLDDSHEAADEVLLLPGAGAQEWAAIFRHAEVLELEEGQTLVEAGAPGDSLYLLTDGVVEVLTADGVSVKTIEAPSVIGEMAFLDRGPRSRSLVARTECDLACFTRGGFDALADADPHLALRLALDLGRIAALRLRLTTREDRA
jgi:CRP/FNR family transcriptional regulator, cyclic AMP receptor protein